MEVSFKESLAAGDLGNKLVPARLDSQLFATVRYPEARLLYDNCIDNTGSVAITESRIAPPTTCLLLGDSYCYPFVKFLAESFGRLVVVHSACLDRRLLSDVQPDVVVNLMAERFLIEVPDDDRDPGLSTHARAKRQAHRTRPPLVYWANHRWPSPAGVEKLREHLLAEKRLADATIVSVLAYGGLLPRELTRLRWVDVGEHELRVGSSDGRANGAPSRVGPIVEPLADDLREWREASGAPDESSPVFPGRGSSHWAEGE